MSGIAAVVPRLPVIREPTPGFFERFPALPVPILVLGGVIALAEGRK